MSLQNLRDLNVFNIHVQNSAQQCCRCGANVQGTTEALHADELCGRCDSVVVTKDGRRVRFSRREAMFYRPGSVYVVHPEVFQCTLRALWSRMPRLPWEKERLACIVKIDGELYVGLCNLNSISLFGRDGTRAREFGLQLRQEHLAALYNARLRAQTERG